MQAFQLAVSDLQTQLKKEKQIRYDDKKRINKLCQQLLQRHDNPYQSALERICKNLNFFKQQNIKSTQLNTKQIINKSIEDFRLKMGKYDKQILKLEEVIKKGCGNIVQKEVSCASSRMTHQNIQFQQRNAKKNLENYQFTYNKRQNDENQLIKKID